QGLAFHQHGKVQRRQDGASRALDLFGQGSSSLDRQHSARGDAGVTDQVRPGSADADRSDFPDSVHVLDGRAKLLLSAGRRTIDEYFARPPPETSPSPEE